MYKEINKKAVLISISIILLSIYFNTNIHALENTSTLINNYVSPNWKASYKTIDGPNIPIPSVGKTIKIKPAMHIASQSIYPPDNEGGNPPNFIQTAFDLPTSGGNGTIAVIDAFNTPTIENDLSTFDTHFGYIPCTTSNSCLEIHNMGTSDSTNIGWKIETDADIEIAHAFAPAAKILLVESVSDSLNDVISAISYANSRSDVIAISMSFAGNEFPQETQYDTYFTPDFNATFFGATGDMSNISGYGDSGSGVTYPAASPYVVAVGGSVLTIANEHYSSESAFPDSVGGISIYEAEPNYQDSLVTNTGNYRAIPDVSLPADIISGSITGYSIYTGTENWVYLTGTSASTPIWAAMRSLSNTYFNNTTLYNNASNNYSYYFSDVTSGSGNSSYCQTMCYPATTGFDYITGLGDPLGLPTELASSTVSTPDFNTTVSHTYNSSINLSGIKDPSISSIKVNGTNTGLTYTSTTWSLSNFPLIYRNNNILIVGYDSGNNASVTNMIAIDRHKLGDINGDGSINLSDFSSFAIDWNHSGVNINNPLSDMNGDGTVNLSDFSIFALNWGH